MKLTTAMWVPLGTTLLLAACMHPRGGQADDRCTPRPHEIFGATADSLLGGVVVSAGVAGQHTERMLYPDPAVRTYNRLYALRRMLRGYREEHGTLPADIAEFSPHDTPGIKWNIDAWGNSIRYTRMGYSEYEIRAPGPDQKLCTEDDMVLRNDVLPARPDVPETHHRQEAAELM